MHLTIFVVAFLPFANAKLTEKLDLVKDRPVRILLHSDGDLMDVLTKTQATLASLNNTLLNVLASARSMNSTINAQNGRIAKLEADLQTERNRRCQAGTTTFAHEECALSKCSQTVTINFNHSFTKIPVLTYGFSLLDVAEDRNLRVSVDALQVTTNAATLKVSTWSDTIVHGSWIRWMACPQ